MSSNKPEKGQNSPTLEKEESKERCTFCSALLPLPELVLHVSACSKTSAVTGTDSDNPEIIQEACPYCGSYFDVLALVKHVDYCKNLSVIRAAEISRGDCSPSSQEEQDYGFLSRRVEDFSLSEKELCPKCSGEFSLLKLLDHADKCTGETPETSSALEFLQTNDHDYLDADDEANGFGDRIDRGNEDDVASDFNRGEDDDEERDNDDNRCIEEDNDINNGDDHNDGSCSDEENSVLGSICRVDGGRGEDEVDFVYGDNDIHLTDDESNQMCDDDEWYANMDRTSDDEHVDVMPETVEDGAESEECEFCPNCRKLFHLTHLIEHASKCPAVLSDVKTSMESEIEFYGTSTSSESSAAAPVVFCDCNFCGIKLSVDMMVTHYPRCMKHHAAKDDKNDKRPTSASGDTSPSLKTKVTGPTGFKREADELKGISSKKTLSALDSYQDCEEQCMYCLKMFAISVLVEHACECATLNKAATEELEQCCYCLRNFPLSELINHAPICDQKTVSSRQKDSRDEVSANSQSSSRELLERCMYCFKDFPVSKLIRHSQRCDGDMSGPRERFQGFLPSVHDLSTISSVAILNDNQRAALQYVISRSAQDSKKVSSGLLTRVKGLGYSESDLTRTLQWIRSAAPIIIHINLDKVLRFLVDDTHYRNQFETGTSGGSTDLRARSSWEDRIFNNSYQRSRPSERVKYGVLNIVGDPRGVKSCVNYGDSFLQLKRVRLRTTFASMDTSGAGVKLSCCEHYENVLFAYSDPEIKAIIDVATGKVSFHRSDCISQYKEVQIHGPVSLSENVECIVVNARHQGDSRMESLLDRFVEQNQCNLIWMDPGDLAGPAPPLFDVFGHYPTTEFLSGGLVRRGGARGHTI